MKCQLTDLVVRSLEPPKRGQRMVRDTLISGFGVRVSQGGTKTFIIVYGQNRKHVTVGRYPLLSLAEARKRARELLLRATVYGDDGPSLTFDEAVERFLSQRKAELKQSTWWSYKTLLERNFSFSGVYVREIQTGMVVEALDAIRTQSQKAHSYTAIKIFFNWCIDRRYLKNNPLASVKKPKIPTSKDRVLSDQELRDVWMACQQMGRYGAIVRLLMVTGQRRNQISRLQESWVDFKKKEMRFPAEVMKNNQAHTIPMSSLAEYVLRCSQPIDGYYFSPVGLTGHPFTAWSKSKVALDRQLPEMDTWTLHDLRRTWATNAARLDIEPQVTDRVLSHTSGTIGPVAKIYNRWNYWDGMVTAMNRMNSHIREAINVREGSLP